MLLVLHSPEGKILDIIPNGEFRDGKIYVQGREVAAGVSCLATLVPDQPVEHLRDPETGLWRGNISDLRQFSAEEKAALIDRETGQAINVNIHPFSPLEEQIGILREQIVHILNTLGLEPTPEFQRLHETAIAEIEKGQMKKEALHAENNQA